jgi:uncharacterized protein (TIGR00645 family)
VGPGGWSAQASLCAGRRSCYDAAARPGGRRGEGIGRMKTVELLVERIILASRWVLVAFVLGLGVALAVYAVAFAGKLAKLVGKLSVLGDADVLLAMLGLIDAALVASLLVMVMISTYENFVSRFDEAQSEVAWVAKLGTGSLKIKVASSIVAISSIHLLGVFMNAQQHDRSTIMWTTIVHLAFVVSALLLGVLERMMHQLKH